MQKLLHLYVATATAIVRRNVVRGHTSVKRAMQEAAHVFATAMLLNAGVLVAVTIGLSKFSKIQWILLGFVAYASFYALHLSLIRRHVLTSSLSKVDRIDDAGVWNTLGNLYLIASAALFVLTVVLIAMR